MESHVRLHRRAWRLRLSEAKENGNGLMRKHQLCMYIAQVPCAACLAARLPFHWEEQPGSPFYSPDG